jgi:hypothetical protein
MPELTISHKHCKNTIYDSLHDDALARAIKEQYPQIEVKKIFADYFIDKNGRQYRISKDYHRQAFYDLKNKLIPDLKVVFEPG